MRAYQITFYSGSAMPDPSYKNVYWYPDVGTDSTDPFVGLNNERPYRFFDQNPDVSKYTFTPASPIYVIGDSDTSFVLDVPTSGSFPSNPCYMAIRTTAIGTSAKYRYAFIMARGTLDEKKVRYTCRFDIWTERFPELIDEQYSISRRHQDRYVDISASPRVKLYNGLNDPIPEGMVQGRNEMTPVPGLFCQTYTDNQDKTHYLIPVWIYWRLSTRTVYQRTGTSPNYSWALIDNEWYGIDPTKSAVPSICVCLGVYDVLGTTVTFHRIADVLNHSGTKIGEYPNTDIRADLLAFSHPYIAQGIITTIPPFKYTLVANGSNYDVKITDTFYDQITVYNPGTAYSGTYRFGTDDDGALVPPVGSFLGFIVYSSNNGKIPPGEGVYITLTTNETNTFDDSYEPKIEESPFENVTFDAFGASLDISPNPGNPKIRLYHRLGVHRDFVFLTGTDEIHRMAGITPSFGLDSAIETIAQWLITSAQTHNNAEIWKGWNNLINTGSRMFQGATSGRTLSAVTPMAAGMMGFMQQVDTEAAFKKDMRNSPNSINIASDNGVDNLPFLDIPRLRRRRLPDDVKQKIMRYWHVYGYPDNRADTIRNSITRESFVYIQATPNAPVRGLLPGEQTDFQTAIASGIWFIRIKTATVHHGEDFGNYYSEIGENKATTTNSEVVEE